jgi:hypothetical protein
MPLIQMFNQGPLRNMPGLIWQYQVDDEKETEEILKNMTDNRVAYLQIMCVSKIKPVMPSLELFNTGHLISLKIHGMDVQNMPPIPSSVHSLEFNSTNISDLNNMSVDWSNIRELSLKLNTNLNGCSLIIPYNMILDTLILELQFFTIIRLPQSTKSLFVWSCRYNQITGRLPSVTLVNNDANGLYPHNSIYNFNRIRNNSIFYDPSLHKLYHNNYFKMTGIMIHDITIKHIKNANDQVNYKLCTNFSNIPKRIKNAYEHRDEPIVAALHLSSNVPRRMAEFVMEFTKIN